MSDSILNPSEIIFERGDWRRRLAAQERQTAERLQDAYARTLPRIREQQRALVDELRRLRESDEEVSPQMLNDLGAMSNLLVRVQTEMNDFAVILRESMTTVSEQAVVTGVQAAENMVESVAGTARTLVMNQWIRPDPAAIANVVNYMDGAPMVNRIASFGDNAARGIQDTVISLVAQGKNPVFIGNQLERWLNVPYAWAQNMARTVQIYSYRGATHASYAANPQVLQGWVWVSARDERTCISCWAKDGMVYRLDQTLNDHHQGRCTPAPIIHGSEWHLTRPTGQDAFAQLDSATQRSIMGNAMHDAWRSGDFHLNEVSVPYRNDIYGEMIRAASLKELRGSQRSLPNFD